MQLVDFSAIIDDILKHRDSLGLRVWNYERISAWLNNEGLSGGSPNMLSRIRNGHLRPNFDIGRALEILHQQLYQ